MTPSFEDFFRGVWGYAPYPWQSRLARDVSKHGWPRVLDLPTGSGKTAVLDIALHHLLLDRGQSAPRRIIMVVDRRVIVDQVGARARALHRAIEAGESPATRAARDILRDIVGDGAPLLEWAVLRGGAVQSDSWAHYPHVPVLAASTVDQVGSRLLFRGYGLSDRARPLHAGLLGCDTLLLLDEVHLARPFAETLEQLLEIRGAMIEVVRRMTVVQLSATPGTARPEHGAPFKLTAEDRRSAALAPILTASKPAALVEVKVRARGDEADKRAQVAERAVSEALLMLNEGRQSVAVVVNRVDTARRVWQGLEGVEGVDRVLVTGRMRPLDQAEALAKIDPRVRAGRSADCEASALVVVATQCIEAGADYDFDGLVTECASLDALRQRFGRLDRRGECEHRSGRPARAVVLARSDVDSGDDPVYGTSLAATWNWLRAYEEAGVDFSSLRMEPLLDALGEGLAELLAPSRPTPAMLPTYLEQWAQTMPRPHADPDVALFLHGIAQDGREALPDAQVIWRADLSEEDFARAIEDEDSRRAIVDRVASVPPGSLEALSLPIWVVRGWLARDADHPDDLADVEGVAATLETRQPSPKRPVLVWRGRRDSEVISIEDIRPGMTVLVPATRGGVGPHGTFDPSALEPVADLGDIVQLQQRGRPTLRLDARVWPRLAAEIDGITALASDPEADLDEAAGNLLSAHVATIVDEQDHLLSLLTSLGARPRLIRSHSSGWVALSRRRSGAARSRARSSRDADELHQHGVTAIEPAGGGDEDDESFPGSDVELARHLEAVGEMAEHFAVRLGLSNALRASLRWAGRIHDVGKADPTFQLMLRGGDPVAARFGAALAKSPMPWQDAAARRRASALSRYPVGQRHELVSLDLIESSESLRTAVLADGGDWDLVLHLVASHHGWCRPLAPANRVSSEEANAVEWIVDDHALNGSTAHNRSRLDSGVARRYFEVGRRLGWHELAYLEAVLRLADHRQSALEAEE